MARTLDRGQVVEHYWPYDGPHDADTITSAAEALAGLLRYLSNATLTRRDLAAPDMYALLGALDEGTGCLRQLTCRLAVAVDGYSQESTLRTDRDRDDPARAQLVAKHAARTLDRLPARLADVHAGFNDARQHLAHLYHDADQPEGR